MDQQAVAQDKPAAGDVRAAVIKPDAPLMVAAFCLAFYVLTLFVPPGPAPFVAPAVDATLLERLFPGVPGWWVVLRLVALLCGALLVAWRVRPPLRVPEPVESTALSAPPAVVMWIALAIATAHAIASQFIDDLSYGEQGLYVSMLFAPGVITWLASRRSVPRPPLATAKSLQMWMLAGLVIAWIAWRLVVVLGNPRVATFVDAWFVHQYLTDAIQRGSNLVRSFAQPGVSNVYFLFTGAGLLHPGVPRLETLQALSILWMAAAGGCTGWSVGQLVSARTVPLAAAMVLFAPLTLWLTVSPFPFGLLLLAPAVMMVLLIRIHSRRSVAALLLLAAVTGLAATQAYIVFPAMLSVVVAVWSGRRQPRLPLVAFVIAALVLLAAWLPNAPAWDSEGMRHEYVDLTFQVSGVENLAFEQYMPAPPEVEMLKRAGRPGPFDIPLGGFLAPFAMARLAVRMCADALLEPWTAALTASGLLLCVRHARRQPVALGWVAAWLFLQLPVMFSSQYDRASINRNWTLPIVSAPIAAMAFEALCSTALRAAWRKRAALFATFLCALSGALLFEWVNPRLLGTSAMQLIFEAIGRDRPPGGVLVLENPNAFYDDWGQVQRMADYFPRIPVPVARYTGPEALLKPQSAAEPVAAAILWSPGLEEGFHVARAVCAQWPAATIYTLYAPSRLTWALAASPTAGWHPQIQPSDRWVAATCAAFQDRFPLPSDGGTH